MLAEAERQLREMAALLDHTDRHIAQLCAVRDQMTAHQVKLADQVATYHRGLRTPKA